MVCQEAIGATFGRDQNKLTAYRCNDVTKQHNGRFQHVFRALQKAGENCRVEYQQNDKDSGSAAERTEIH